MSLNFQNRNGASANRVLLIVLLIVSLVMATVYSREGESGPLHAIQGAVGSIAAPLKFVGASASSGMSDAQDALTDASADDATLSQLREQNAELRELVAQTEEYRQEVERLEGLLDLKESSGAEGIGGRIIGRNTDASLSMWEPPPACRPALPSWGRMALSGRWSRRRPARRRCAF